MAAKKIHSFKDSRGYLFVDCSECTKGGNGDQSCSSGWQQTKPKHGGCFMGKLLENLTLVEPPSIA